MRSSTKLWIAAAVYGLAVLVAIASPNAQVGSTATNGTTSADPNGNVGLVPKNGFLFEPEVPATSLKGVPIWNELEQLLDNPYNVALCSVVSPGTLTGNTPGTTQINSAGNFSPTTPVWPSYCTTPAVVRRPGFGVTLPPLLVHPLNYNPTDGEEMRLINPRYGGGNWVVPDTLFQCSDPTAPASVRALCALRGFSPTAWLFSYRNVVVTAGGERVAEAEIDYNAPIRPNVAGFDGTSTPDLFNLAAGLGTPAGLVQATAQLDANQNCIASTEVFPPERDTFCGGDPGEPGYPGFGVILNPASQYSLPAVPGGSMTCTLVNGLQNCTVAPLAGANTLTGLTARLFDATRGGVIPPRNVATGTGGLNKPSLRIAANGGNGTNPNYLLNRDPNTVTPSNENDYVRDRAVGAALGKSLFWEQQIGSDAVQACGSCHAHAGADNRTKNQMNPNDIGGDVLFEVQPANGELVVTDFPFNKYRDPDIAGDPACTTPITASVGPAVLENTPQVASVSGTAATGVTIRVCDAANAIPNKNNRNGQPGFAANDVASSMGVHFGVFYDIPPIGGRDNPATPRIEGSFGPGSAIGGVRSLVRDRRSTDATDRFADAATRFAAENTDPIPGFQGTDGTGHGIRRVEPRNTPTIFAAALNFDNFWDGRARHDFNGGSVFGASDPQAHVWIDDGAANSLKSTRQIIRFVSIASLATGPALSQFEMSFAGRNWAKLGKKLLQRGVTPLANQLVDPTDSVIGLYSNQGGSACAGLPAADRSPYDPTHAIFRITAPGAGVPGLCISYPALIQRAFYPALHTNTTRHLVGCYTDGRADIHPNQCVDGSVPILSGGVVNTANIADPFDGYKLAEQSGPAVATDTNQFTQMEANFSLFFGLGLHVWAAILMPDNTPFDQFLDQNPDAFEAIGEVGEPGLVGPLPLCTSALQRHCFREVGNFKRDTQGIAPFNCNALPGSGETGGTVSITPCYGTRTAGQPDPLLGMDIFEGSNLSLKNPNFRAARCGECHAGATLTDNTVPFTFKAQLGDFIGEFLSKGNEALIEPLGRTRVISGFLLESEFNENGQDAIERRLINQSISPCPADGLAYPGGIDPVRAFGPGFGLCAGAAQSLFDNGVYNLGVTRCQASQTAVTGVCDDNGRGNTDPFGWPMSLAALLLKNISGPGQEPGVALPNYDPLNPGVVLEETAQDQSLNPGVGDDIIDPRLPPYLAPFANDVPVGDTMPELDELHAGLNTLTDLAMLEGFIDILGPFNPAGVLNESMNNGEGPEMGTWPIVNRVGRFGSIKAPQLREVELTGPYFHSGATLTLRQVVDFYARGGNYPVTNAEHRDFNIINLNIEVQSNLTELEKVALVDFLLELTDDRVRFERGPFDHPQMILPLDGTAPENGTTTSALRDAALTGCVDASRFGPGQRACMGGMFLDVPAVGANGNPGGALPNFLNITSGPRLVGAAANCGDLNDPNRAVTNHYCR
jgi:cytochrome c peroxidase